MLEQMARTSAVTFNLAYYGQQLQGGQGLRQAAYFIGKKGPAALVLSEKLVVGMLVTYVLKISIGTFFAERSLFSKMCVAR